MKFTKSRWNTFLSLCQPCSQLENGDKIDLLATRQEQRSPLEVAYALVNGMFENDRTRAISSPLHHELFLVLGWFLSLSSHNKLKVSVDSSSKFSLSSLEHLKSNLWLKIKKKKRTKHKIKKKTFSSGNAWVLQAGFDTWICARLLGRGDHPHILRGTCVAAPAQWLWISICTFHFSNDKTHFLSLPKLRSFDGKKSRQGDLLNTMRQPGCGVSAKAHNQALSIGCTSVIYSMPRVQV